MDSVDGTDGRLGLGVWLVLAKKGTSQPTSLTYEQALEEALCHGWIDGQVGRRDDATYRQRFTPRRRRSAWSKRNATIAERLLAEDRMHAAGIEEVERAKADGRWQTAYAGSASIEVPPDLRQALTAEPKAQTMFGRLSPPGPLLGRGDTIYPQSRTSNSRPDDSPDCSSTP